MTFLSRILYAAPSEGGKWGEHELDYILFLRKAGIEVKPNANEVQDVCYVKREELKERIRVAYAIADAMEYLHSLDILFRDLKPGKYSLEGWRFFRSTLDLTVSDAYRYPMQTTLVLMRMEW